jgi:Tol biopolymer transport system component
VLLIIPLNDGKKATDRNALEWLREDYVAFNGRFSPDGHFLAYMSNETDVLTAQIYVRPFDPNKPGTPVAAALPVTNLKGGASNIYWRQDGKEMYFLNRDREVMVADLSTSPKLQAGTPQTLFKIPDPLAGVADVSPDGERFILYMPVK